MKIIYGNQEGCGNYGFPLVRNPLSIVRGDEVMVDVVVVDSDITRLLEVMGTPEEMSSTIFIYDMSSKKTGVMGRGLVKKLNEIPRDAKL